MYRRDLCGFQNMLFCLLSVIPARYTNKTLWNQSPSFLGNHATLNMHWKCAENNVIYSELFVESDRQKQFWSKSFARKIMQDVIAGSFSFSKINSRITLKLMFWNIRRLKRKSPDARIEARVIRIIWRTLRNDLIISSNKEIRIIWKKCRNHITCKH